MHYLSLLTLAGVAYAGTKNRDDLYDHMDGGVLDAHEANEVENMSAEEKQERLLAICRKADKNGDGLLTEEELRAWMDLTTNHYMEEDINTQFPAHDENDDGKIEWHEYRQSTFNIMSPEDFKDNELSMDEMEARDRRRFNRADTNSDGYLSRDEFGGFLHPEDHSHMKDIVLMETLEDLDSDGDGLISEDEYINDMYHPKEENRPDEEPEWIGMEREHFQTIRDLDGDGKLDLKEVKEWLMPIEYDHVEAEAKHLIQECDDDRDGALNFGEVLAKYHIFMTSQATNWGEALTYHEEL